MKAKSLKAKNASELRKNLNVLLSDGFSPTLAIVFVSVHVRVQEILDVFTQMNIRVFGASSHYEFTDDEFEADTAAILLLDLDRDLFHLILEDIPEGEADLAGQKVGHFGIKSFTNPLFIISASHLDTPGQIIIDALIDVAGSEAKIVGGMAAEEGYKGRDFVIKDESINYRGLTALILDGDRIQLEGSGISGWKKLGTPRMVTKSEGNWLLDIDNQPALDVLTRYIGIASDSDMKELLEMGSLYPLQLVRENNTNILMPIIEFDRDRKAVMCPRPVETGTQFFLTVPPDFDVVERVVEKARDIRKSTLASADALVVFSCVSRKDLLGPLANEEIGLLQGVWNVPMAGFFCYGEFGKTEDISVPEFIGTTCNWCVLKEKE